MHIVDRVKTLFVATEDRVVVRSSPLAVCQAVRACAPRFLHIQSKDIAAKVLN